MINIKRLFFVLAFFACFFTSEDSNAQKINQFDKNKKRTGVWKKYYPNKRIRYSGKFKNGKEVGVFKFYDITQSDHPVIIKTFFEDSDSLFVQFYTLSGKIETEGVLNGKKRTGNWKYFYPDGTLLSEENYKDGKLEGEQLIYYPDGQVTEFAIYKDGLLDGVCSKYSSKGILIEEITYENGKPNGLAQYFELNGNLKETGHYKNGKRVGEWEYYMDGEIASDEVKKEKKKSTYTKKKDN
ncbi:toxin-antitoxin system YwqK family antitoxin [Polaribacter pectinis]|uniref:Toxin-antitoxin system YwqK family antitoxin n=1 Tax=Polaribacter pectinis TaxID=2738844 RepID=A0A7G9LC21_9FLAO|nr:toxin-antitoxin system YwqK family antitoxin [Polaribacter pectinis]QNM86170.1 toxin-antitoxin system YwqK family antitoxin [Polaribacter pectinis]